VRDATPDVLTSLKEVPRKMSRAKSHRHTTVTTHVLRQRAGVPYEIERKVCSSCSRVIDERPLRRAAA